MNFIQTSCIRIPLSFKDEAWFQQIVKHLTRSSSSYSDPTIFKTSKFYDIKNGDLLIPKFYPIEKLGHTKTVYLSEGEDIQFNFKAEWKNDLQKQGFEFLISNKSGVLQLPPGEGKTVITIGSISKIGKKSIIFTHKDSLITQWKERFLQFTDLMEENIGILENSKIEEVFKKPIVLATVQSLCSAIKRFPNIEQILKDANFGCAFWDECHITSGAEEYSKTVLYTPCMRTYGLSATPGRADQNHDIIWMNIGDVYKPDGKSNTLDPKIIMVYFDHGVISRHKKYVYWGIPDKEGNFKLRYPRFDSCRYLQMLTSKKNDKYIPYMKKICLQIYQAGRNVLFISDRIKILDECSKIISNKNDVGFFIPRSGDKRDSDLLKKFVFSTPGSSRDGTDKPEFDCLIMANCISNIEQAAGRVCRSLPGKKQPIIFDIVDNSCQDTLNRSLYRKKFYESKGWKIEEKFLK